MNQLNDFCDSITNTLDIRSNGLYPSNVLSNLCSNGFRFDGMLCGSMEGFLQSLKYKDRDKQRQICSMKGGNARKRSVTSWQTDQIVWWKGTPIDRQGADFRFLVKQAYQAMFEQSQRFRDALMQTRGMRLIHTIGESNPYKTILTAQEFCGILTEIRDAYDQRDKKLPRRRKRVFVELDNVLVDLLSDLVRHNVEENKVEFIDKANFSINLKPVPGAMDAMHELQKYFDLYVVTTVPWENPSVYLDKVKWIVRYLDKIFHKRIIITHSKNLCKGDYLIDSSEKYGTSEFEGEWIKFGCDFYPDWPAVIAYLREKEFPDQEVPAV